MNVATLTTLCDVLSIMWGLAQIWFPYIASGAFSEHAQISTTVQVNGDLVLACTFINCHLLSHRHVPISKTFFKSATYPIPLILNMRMWASCNSYASQYLLLSSNTWNPPYNHQVPSADVYKPTTDARAKTGSTSSAFRPLRSQSE